MNTGLHLGTRLIKLCKSFGWTPVYTKPNEVATLVALASMTNGTIVEIGCNEGRTTLALANAFPGRRVIGIDYTRSSAMVYGQSCEQPRASFVGRLARHMDNVSILDCLSHLAPIQNRSAGFVFIDGDHTCNGVSRDTASALHWLARSGIIVWHDYFEPECGANPPDYVKVREAIQQTGLPYKTIPGTCIAYYVSK